VHIEFPASEAVANTLFTFTRSKPRRPAEDGPHPREQFTQTERLNKVVVRTQL